jgi:hypothetical protein
MGQFRAIVSVFIIDDRIGISIGDRGALIFIRLGNKPFGRTIIRLDILILGIRLRNLPVLAVLTMKIAADGRYRKNTAARQKMKERFFFDRVDMDGAGIAIDDGSQHAVDIDSDPAFTALAGLNQAQLRT